uniref:WAP domain-containing protein n=1 Tax=Caenorhabditis tropicalis TaxID=1561998 RepID=A0A1I7TA99_9PELO
MRTVSILVITFLDIVLCLAPTPHIDWCLYWRYLNKDQYRPECNGVYRLRFAKHKAHDHRPQQIASQSVPWTPARPVPRFNSFLNTNSIISTTNENGFGECRAHHTSCQQSGQCSSGQLCIDSNGYCCGMKRIVTECPDPSSLVAHCAFRRRHVNWCASDSECAPHLAPRHNTFFSNDATLLDSIQQAPSLCCPTQCGYNVCVR